MWVRYARPQPGAALSEAHALALAARALERLGERDEPEERSDEERLIEALERVAEEAGEASPRELAAAALDQLASGGWVERARSGETLQLLVRPELLRLTALRVWRSLFVERSRGSGFWPRTGVRGPHEPHGPARPWRWGEPLNLDPAATLKAWLPKPHPTLGDLRVREGEGGRRLAVALLLDCSHSMVLYGSGRFGPAKRLALALYYGLGREGNRLQVICFHDVAEAVPPERLPFLRAQPSHTNTAAALSQARAWLRRQGDAERRALLVTDGRPTAVLLPDGRLYKNAWGRDPVIEKATLAAAAQLRRAGAELDVYLLSDEESARKRVRELAASARGQVHEVDPEHLGRRVLTDLMHAAR